MYEVYFNGPCHIGQMLAFAVEISEELFVSSTVGPGRPAVAAPHPPSHTLIAVSAFVPMTHAFLAFCSW